MFIQKNNEYLTLITSTSLPCFQQQTSHRQASKFSLVRPHSPQLTLIFSNVTLIKKLSAEYWQWITFFPHDVSVKTGLGMCVWEWKPSPSTVRKAGKHIWSIWSVFIIHIHIDRFLIQHVFNIVTVFFSAGPFFFPSFFFYKNNNKNDKDNTMGNFMAMLLNGFCTSRWSRCGVAVLGEARPASAWRVSKVTKKTQNVPSLRDDRTLLQHPVHSPTATRGHSSCLWEHVRPPSPQSSSVHVTNICTWKIRSSVWVFHEYYLYSKNPGDEK